MLLRVPLGFVHYIHVTLSTMPGFMMCVGEGNISVIITYSEPNACRCVVNEANVDDKDTMRCAVQ